VERLHIEPCPDVLLSNIAQSKRALHEELARLSQNIATEIRGCNPAAGMHQMRVELLSRVLPPILSECEQY
jgi:hypothetical protein